MLRYEVNYQLETLAENSLSCLSVMVFINFDVFVTIVTMIQDEKVKLRSLSCNQTAMSIEQTDKT